MDRGTVTLTCRRGGTRKDTQSDFRTEMDTEFQTDKEDGLREKQKRLTTAQMPNSRYRESEENKNQSKGMKPLLYSTPLEFAGGYEVQEKKNEEEDEGVNRS